MVITFNQILSEFRDTQKSLPDRLGRIQQLLESAASEENQSLRNKDDATCTQEIANMWNIPKFVGSRKQLLDATIFDILPPIPPRGQRKQFKGVVLRLHRLIQNKQTFLVGQCAAMTRERLFRHEGLQTEILLRYCLSWNGLTLGMPIKTESFDHRAFISLEDLIDDLPESTQESLLCKLAPIRFPREDLAGNYRTGLLFLWSKKELARSCHLTEEEISILEGKLTYIGRKFKD